MPLASNASQPCRRARQDSIGSLVQATVRYHSRGLGNAAAFMGSRGSGSFYAREAVAGRAARALTGSLATCSYMPGTAVSESAPSPLVSQWPTSTASLRPLCVGSHAHASSMSGVI
eukprot:5341987-Prymnesium_polylepis.1